MNTKRLNPVWLKGSLVALALVSGTAVNAIPITGSVSFVGFGDLNGTTLTFAQNSATVSSGTQSGAYVGLDGKVATFTSFNYASDMTVTPLWTLTFNGVTYSFDASSVDVDTGTSYPFLNLYGTGSAYISGAGMQYDPTPGTWAISALQGGNGARFSFVASSTAVPDGGLTVLLLGVALSALGLFSKRFV